MPVFSDNITNAYSLEVSAGSVPALVAAAARIPPGSLVAIPYLPGEDDQARLATARTVRGLGLQPLLHLSARRIVSHAALESLVGRAVGDAGVEHCLVIAGDPARAEGPFSDSLSLIDTGVLERSGIKAVGVAGHPQPHPVMSEVQRWDALERKCLSIEARGMRAMIFTQFAFDAEAVLGWLHALRARGLSQTVRVGVAGPAGIAVLLRYAALCGVDACTSVLSRYGLSIGRLFGRAGPDAFVDQLAAGLSGVRGPVELHFFPFGGIAQSLDWIDGYRRRTGT